MIFDLRFLFVFLHHTQQTLSTGNDGKGLLHYPEIIKEVLRMNDDFSVREIALRFPDEVQQLCAFLPGFGLRCETDIEVAFGVYDADDTLLGCGCAAGSLLKCFAVRESLRGQNALGALVSALVQNRFAAGYYDLFVITRAHNEALFTACGFFTAAKTDALVMLENRRNGPESFCRPLLQPEDEGKCVGAIVMNCNPFTLGHLALVEYAAASCDALHLFVVEENKSFFDTASRFALVEKGTAHLSNVRVHLSGHYMISSATFPTYFLKEGEDASLLYARLDITLFAQRIAPTLHIRKRFAGQEPFDPTTACYNRAMRDILPQHGVEFCEIPRKEADGTAISASRVRELLRNEGCSERVLAMVPESTGAYLKAHFPCKADEV